jgi:isoleucyl-tRNA synthetase
VHGFTVDESNRKMSKSLGNTIEPHEAIRGSTKSKLPQCGNDVLRFWVAHDHQKPYIQVGANVLEKFLKRVFEIRSILRFMVANLTDLKLDETNSLVDYEHLMPVDKYILTRLNDLIEKTTSGYEDMNMSKSLLQIESFFLTELSSFYIKAIKDRLYCEKADGLPRRSAQTSLYHLTAKCLCLIAPIMPHLAEEAYQYSNISGKSNEAEPRSLFRRNVDELAAQLECNNEWNSEIVDNLFRIVFRIRESFFEQIQSDNAITYDLSVECGAHDIYELIDSQRRKLALETTNRSDEWDWLAECVGCSSVDVTYIAANASSGGVGDVPAAVLSSSSSLLSVLDKIKVRANKISEKKFMCKRCRRYKCSSASEELCPRCFNLINQK